MGRWKDYDRAAKFKSLMDRHATKIIQQLRPGETFATVTAMDEAMHRCEAIFAGEENPVRLPCDNVLGIEVGNTVRVGGEPGRRHVIGVVNASGLLTPSSAAGGDLTGLYPDPEIGDGKVRADHIATDHPHCRAYRATQTIPTGVDTKVLMTSEDYDSTGSMHSTSSNTSRIIAPRAGLYSMGAWCQFDVGLYSSPMSLAILLNNTTNTVVWRTGSMNGSVAPNLNVVTDYRMAANDYIEVVVAQGTAGDLVMNVGVGWLRWERP